MTPDAGSPIGRTLSSLKRMASPLEVDSSTSCAPVVTRAQPRASSSATLITVNGSVVTPGRSSSRTRLTTPASVVKNRNPSRGPPLPGNTSAAARRSLRPSGDNSDHGAPLPISIASGTRWTGRPTARPEAVIR